MERIHGYTLAELRELHIKIEGQWTELSRWPSQNDYIADPNNWFTETVDPPPIMEPTRHKSAYIRDSVNALDQVRRDVDMYAAQLMAHIESMEHEIRDHLWVTPDFIEPAAVTLDQTASTVAVLAQRIADVRKGFEMLPQDDREPGAIT